jgi:hypothetical protein
MTVVILTRAVSDSLVYLELLFLRYELKMAIPVVEFMTKECRAVMKFPFFKGKRVKQMYDDVSVIWREKFLQLDS